MDPYLVVLGRAHPLLVHFPIALLVTAVGVVAWRRLRGIDGPAEALFVYVGAASAVLAAALGLLWASVEPSRGSEAEQLFLHRTLTLAGTVLAVAAAVLYARGTAGRNDMIKILLLCCSAGLVGAGGHQGAMLVFGEDHFSGPFEAAEPEAVDPEPVEPEAVEIEADEPEKKAPESEEPEKKAPESKAPEEKEPEKKAPEAKPAETKRTVDFQEQVWPIFKKSCIKCHGAKKKKGKLRLDKKSFAMKGGESGKVIKPGDHKKSKLYQLISLPEDDEDIMPSKGDLLTQEQQQLIATWIDEGAHWPE